MSKTLFDAIGGINTLKTVHKNFYDKVYAHPWLGKFFEGHNQQAIEDRQTAFMGEKMGGPIEYMGKPPKLVHEHMYISDELFALRQQLLAESLKEANVPDEAAEQWLKLDSAFRLIIVKDNFEEFKKKSWPYKKHIIIPKPHE